VNKRLIGTILLATVCSIGFAAGKSYLFLVGELYAGVELPRLAKEYCATAQPSTSKTIGSQYEAWSERNAAFLSRAREQFARANERLKSEGASLASADATLLQRIKTVDSGKFCRAYADVLKAKEKQFGTDLGELLVVVENADADLSRQPR